MVFNLWGLNYLSIVVQLIRLYSLLILIDVIEQSSQTLRSYWRLRTLFISFRD